jgi:hypothetical protein
LHAQVSAVNADGVGAALLAAHSADIETLRAVLEAGT